MDGPAENPKIPGKYSRFCLSRPDREARLAAALRTKTEPRGVVIRSPHASHLSKRKVSVRSPADATLGCCAAPCAREVSWVLRARRSAWTRIKTPRGGHRPNRSIEVRALDVESRSRRSGTVNERTSLTPTQGREANHDEGS